MNKLSLEDQLCFKLYALSRLIIGNYRAVLEKLDITYPQYLVMLILWEEKNISVKDLGNRLYLDSGTLTPLLKRLEQKGLLIRERNAADERSVTVSLCTAGKELKKKASKVPGTLGQCLQLSQKQYLQIKSELDSLLAKVTDESLIKL